MNRNYSVSNELWAAVAPFFPTRGPQNEQEQRLFFEAVVFMLRKSLSWRMLPAHFDNCNTVFIRFNRYARAGVGERMFKSLSPVHVAELQIDSTTIKAHRHASGAAQKRGAMP